MKIVKEMKRPIWDKEKLLRRLDGLTGDDRLFFLSYGLFMITSLLSTSFFYKYYEGRPCMWLQILCMVLLAAYEYRNGFLKEQQWIPGLILTGMTMISLRVALGSQTRMVPMMFTYIYCARRIPFAKIARFTLRCGVAIVSVVVLAGYLGIVENVVMFKSGRVREFMGFRYALYLPGILLNLTALWIWLKKDKITLSGSLVWAVVNWVVYYLTDSRISFLLAEALLVIALLMKWAPEVVKKLRPVWAALVPIFFVCGGGSLLLTACYSGKIPWMRQLNTSLEGRLNLGQKSLRGFGVNLFGRKIEWVGNGLTSSATANGGVYNYVDCLYVKILLVYGAVFAIALILMLCWSMYKLWKRREYLTMVICASVAVHCVLDDLSFTLHYNTFWIAMGMAVMAPAMLNWDGNTTKINPSELQNE